MPFPRHDAINQLFRDRPALAAEVLRELMAVDVPLAGPVRVESNDFNDRPSKDFTPDTVITIGPRHEPAYGIIVEVQQGKSVSKRRQLPRYAAEMWLMTECPVAVLCVCPEADAAVYYAEPIVTGLPGYMFRAHVLGPGNVPILADPVEVVTRPELATLGVMVHGERRGVAEAFVAGLADLDKPDHAAQYYEYGFTMAAPVVRRILEEIMSSTSWPVYSPFAREHFGRGKTEGRAEGRNEGRAEGRVEGRNEGRAEGRVEGRTEGRVEGEAGSVLKVLAARRIKVPEEARTRISTCTDERQLDIWLERAVVATSVTELFD